MHDDDDPIADIARRRHPAGKAMMTIDQQILTLSKAWRDARALADREGRLYWEGVADGLAIGIAVVSGIGVRSIVARDAAYFGAEIARIKLAQAPGGAP